MTSQLFENVFSSGSSGILRVCSCGRTYFEDDPNNDWEDGELEELREKAKKNPQLYIPVDYSILTYSIVVNENEVVVGCPCGEIDSYENFINHHASEIAEYLNKKAAGLERMRKKNITYYSPIKETNNRPDNQFRLPPFYKKASIKDPIVFIKTIRESFAGSEYVYIHGSCYQFYLILKMQFPQARPYHYHNDDHIITKIGKTFYDITGIVSGENYKPLDIEKWNVNHKFSLWNCGLECPSCDEIVTYSYPKKNQKSKKINVDLKCQNEKIPVQVEAFQYFCDMADYTYEIPVWFNQAILDREIFNKEGKTFIKTREGNLELSNEDWVIRGYSEKYGYHFWINKPDYFSKAYRKVEKSQIEITFEENKNLLD